MKQCCSCLESKSETEFNRHKSMPDGLQKQCKLCHRRTSNKFHNNNKELMRSRNRRNNLRQYWPDVDPKLRQGMFDALLESQNHSCAICLEPLSNTRGTHIDHDHATKRVRGILCLNCNHGLGKFKDSVSLLENAIDYLKKVSL